jgi:thiamine-phosphate pyrophosphorylase
MISSQDRPANWDIPLKPIADCRLYTFVDTGYLQGRDPVRVARELCAGGADIIQLRAKQQSAAEVEDLAKSILPVTRSAGIIMVINDHVDIALRVGAPACHLGQEDFFDAGHLNVSCLTPPGSKLCIGLSSHAPDEALRAVSAGAHYVAVGPVFATPTKPRVKPVTLDYVRWASENIRIPWFAIGGITLGNLEAVAAAGARRICVVSGILNASDIAGACREFRRRLGD